jgi:hypothetical protein
MQSRNDKLGHLLRLNQRRLSSPNFLRALGNAVGHVINDEQLLSFPETDDLFTEFSRGYGSTQDLASGYRKTYERAHSDEVFRLCICLATKIAGDEARLLMKQSQVCGAVKMNADEILLNARSVIQLDGDSVSVLSWDRTEGILIDYNPDDVNQTYELAVWGFGWTSALVECLAS